mmetsp:Transcript_27663/g.33584  ORF Transcript_27663/g.33584 Transcript_27663/m.33584 type:complete len:98 (+) Transcript_27663:179-472(+)
MFCGDVREHETTGRIWQYFNMLWCRVGLLSLERETLCELAAVSGRGGRQGEDPFLTPLPLKCCTSASPASQAKKPNVCPIVCMNMFVLFSVCNRYKV